MAIYPVAAGGVDYSSTSSNKYISAVYSALMVKKFYPTSTFGEIANTDYEGEIKNGGDSVIIRTRPTIETFKYKKGMVLPIQNPNSPAVGLKIDKGNGFSFAIDRVDEFQSNIKLMNEWSDDAAEQMKQVIDKQVFEDLALAATDTPVTMTGTYTTATGISHTLGTSSSSISCNDGDEVLAHILELGCVLDENNIPEEGRFIVLPAWAIKNLKNSTLKNVYVTGDLESPLRNGKVGTVDRFKLFMSNNLYSTTSHFAIPFGTKYGLTFATQITESRIIDNPFGFGKLMQGLQVYGYNVLKPEAIGISWIINS